MKETVTASQSALVRRHPLEARLLDELVSIGINRPEWQDRILNGETLRFKPCSWTDPSNGKDIPEEYYQSVEIRMENQGKDSFISMCGMRIADFFKQIWAKVTEVLGLKRRQEEEQRRQQKPDIPKRGFRM